MKEKEFKRWLLERDYSFRTIENSLRYIRFLEKKGLKVDEVKDVEDVLEFFAELRSKGTTRKTLNYYIKALNRYFMFRGLDVKLKYYRTFYEADLKVPTDEEVQRLLSLTWSTRATTLRNRAILAALFTTGVRVEECRNLDWNDIDEEDMTIKIRHGKFGKTRIVPLPQWVYDLLMEYKMFQEKSDPNAMFTSYRGRLSNAYLRKIVKEAGKKAGIPWFHAHAARHWRALKWLKEGVNLETIRILMGHSALKTTQIYLRALSKDEAFQEVREKDSLFKVRKYTDLGVALQSGGVKND